MYIFGQNNYSKFLRNILPTHCGDLRKAVLMEHIITPTLSKASDVSKLLIFSRDFVHTAAEEVLNQVVDGRYLYSRQVAQSGGKFKPIFRPLAQSNHQVAQSSRPSAQMAPTW